MDRLEKQLARRIDGSINGRARKCTSRYLSSDENAIDT